MDFRRIQGIFFIVFCCLNIFLFLLYQEGKKDDTTSPGTLANNIEARLKDDRIKLPHQLSTKQRQGYFLSGEATDLSREIQKHKITHHWEIAEKQLHVQVDDNGNEVLDKEDPLSDLAFFLADPMSVSFGTAYEFLDFVSDVPKSFVFGQSWEEIPFFDPTSQLTIATTEKNNDALIVSSYTQTFIENIEPLREKQSLISEREAVIALYMNNRLSSNMKIQWIELAYTRLFTVKERHVYIPAWFVSVQVGKAPAQVERVNAINGSILTNNISEVKNH